MKDLINICVVGLGHWGPNIVRSLQSDSRVNVSLAVEKSPERREFIKTKIPDLNVSEDFDTCVEDPTIVAVVTATPTEQHYQLGMQALNAGKHLFIEKPIAHSTEAAQELIALAAEKGRILMTGHVFLYNEAIVEMKNIVDRGTLGNILYMRAVRTNLGPIRSDVNVLWDLASHDISIFNYIFNDLPIEVSCSAFSALGRHVEDIAQASLVYPDNRVAMVFASWLDPRKSRKITVVGDQKMLLFDDLLPEHPLKIFDKGVRVEIEPGYFRLSVYEGNNYNSHISTGEPLKNECSHFVDCILSATRPMTDGENGLEVVRTLEALTRSLNENGRPVNLWHTKTGSLGDHS